MTKYSNLLIIIDLRYFMITDDWVYACNNKNDSVDDADDDDHDDDNDDQECNQNNKPDLSYTLTNFRSQLRSLC